MDNTYYANNWEEHIMGMSSGHTAFHVFENDNAEISAVNGALQELNRLGILSSNDYNREKFMSLRTAVKEECEIPWTGISPRMQRLIYAINAIKKPKVVVCAGIFCGYTFICNIGAAIGPGACYQAEKLLGFEILEQEVKRASRNVGQLGTHKEVTILCADTAEWLSTSDTKIDLLYIDAKPVDWNRTWPKERDPSEYYKIVKAALPNLPKNALVVAHNSMNAASYLSDYLAFVRSDQFQGGVNLAIDDSGLEVTLV